MRKRIESSDGAGINYREEGDGSTALLFVHGWLGNLRWWDAQVEHFRAGFRTAAMDLAGHGESDRSQSGYSSDLYADGIRSVAEALDAERVVLIGHSMAGPFVLEASLACANVAAVVLVDTVKNIEKQMDLKQAEELLFSAYRRDFPEAVTTLLPKFLFRESTPAAVVERLTNEFLTCDGETAVALIEPLYRMDLKTLAPRVRVPVLAVNSDFSPTDTEVSRRYFNDYSHYPISGTAHYPMLENPDEFNRVLERALAERGLR